VNPTHTIPAIAPAVQSPPRRKQAVPLYAVLAVLTFCAFWTMLGSMVVQGARLHDFLSFYTGASLARDGSFAGLYSPEVQLQRQREYAQVTELVPYIRPLPYAMLIAPFAWLPLGAAFWAWLLTQSAVLAGTWVWAFRRWGPDALIFGSMFLPTALGIAHGQDCVLLLAIVLGVYGLAHRQKDFLSGVVLGAGLIKFNLFLLWPIALLVQRRWRMLAGACVAIAAELLLWLALAGPGGIAKYIALLLMGDLRMLNPSPELMLNVRALAINWGADKTVVVGVLTAAAVLLTAAACWRAPLWRWIAAASAGSLLVTPHVYGYDAGLLLVALWLAVFQSSAKWPRITATILLTPIPFLASLGGSPWASAAPLALLAFLTSLACMTLHTMTPENFFSQGFSQEERPL